MKERTGFRAVFQNEVINSLPRGGLRAEVLKTPFCDEKPPRRRKRSTGPGFAPVMDTVTVKLVAPGGTSMKSNRNVLAGMVAAMPFVTGCGTMTALRLLTVPTSLKELSLTMERIQIPSAAS